MSESESELQATVELLLANNYISLAIVTAVVYDYLITFPSEIDYIWCRPWSWVSTMFVLVRYVGLSWTIIDGFVGNGYSKGSVISLVEGWEYEIFLAAADLVMILRVYAMWTRSKTILCALLVIYVAQIGLGFILTGMYGNPLNSQQWSVTVTQIANFTFCEYNSNAPSQVSWCFVIPRFLLGAALLALAVAQTLKQSLEMYKATKQWQPNRYMKLFMKDGILYFLANVFNNIANFVETSSPNSNWMFPFVLLGPISICVIVPRFITNVRELFDRNVCGHRQGTDIGFGLSSQSSVGSRNFATSAIAFAEFTPAGQSQTTGEDVGELEQIRLEEWR